MRALVLSGGGSKGAFQVGVLKRWMGEQGTDYDIMCGSSVGALNIAGLASAPFGRPKEAIRLLENFWLTKIVGTKSVYRRWWPFGRWHSLWKTSVYDSTPLIHLIRENIDPVKVASCGRLLAVGAVCLDTGEHEFGTGKDPRFIDWVLASASYPVFLAPVEINGKLYSDGGMANVTPLGQAMKMGASEIDVIMCADPWLNEPWNATNKAAVPHQIVRTMNLMSERIARFDMEEFMLKNHLAESNAKYRKAKVRLVFPSQCLGADSLTFDPVDIRRMIDLGYEDSCSFISYD